jgi:hypothetical protein
MPGSSEAVAEGRAPDSYLPHEEDVMTQNQIPHLHETMSLENRYELAQGLLAEMIRRVELIEDRCYRDLHAERSTFEDKVGSVLPMIELLNLDLERISQEALEFGILDTMGNPILVKADPIAKRQPRREGGAA